MQLRQNIKHIEVLIDHPEISNIVAKFAQANIRELIHPPAFSSFKLTN